MKVKRIISVLLLLMFVIILTLFFQCRYDEMTRKFRDEINENPQNLISHITYEQLPNKYKHSITKTEYMALSTDKELLEFYSLLDKATDLSHFSLTPSYYITFSGRTPLSTLLVVEGKEYTVLHYIEVSSPSILSDIPKIKSWKVSILASNDS